MSEDSKGKFLPLKTHPILAKTKNHIHLFFPCEYM